MRETFIDSPRQQNIYVDIDCRPFSSRLSLGLGACGFGWLSVAYRRSTVRDGSHSDLGLMDKRLVGYHYHFLPVKWTQFSIQLLGKHPSVEFFGNSTNPIDGLSFLSTKSLEYMWLENNKGFAHHKVIKLVNKKLYFPGNWNNIAPH